MSKFIEDFLDEQLTDEYLSDAFQTRLDGDLGPLEAKVKVFKDGLLIIEADRLLFKTINAFAAKLLQEDRIRVIQLLYGGDQQELDVEAHCLFTFVKELLSFQLMSFLKRVQIFTRMHSRLRDLISGGADEKALDNKKQKHLHFYKVETFMTNLRWALHTVHHCSFCIQAVNKNNDTDGSRSNSEMSDEESVQSLREKGPMGDLEPYLAIISNIVNEDLTG